MFKILYLAILLIIYSVSSQAAEDEWRGAKYYEDEIQKMGINPEWLTCETKDDCGLFSVTCGQKYAANVNHLKEARDGYCEKHEDCISSACVQPNDVSASCVQGYCVSTSKYHK